jgi:hypothetical protein
MDQPIDNAAVKAFENIYMNKMQIKANLIDPNVLVGRIARAGGKDEGIIGPRSIKVGFSMPGEISFLIHKTYVAAMTNMMPALLAYYKRPIGEKQEPMFKEGIDYIFGTSKLPNHFQKPRVGIAYPKHALVLRTGHTFQIVSSDQPESVAGQSAVHAIINEMKHQKGSKVKTRIFPALRTGPSHVRNSPYYQGITGVSDTARVDLGEDNWFEEYEENMNPDLIDELANSAKHLNDAMVKKLYLENLLLNTKDNNQINNLKKEIWKCEHIVQMWNPIVRDQRKAATYYITASSFVNKDILGVGFFKTMFESLTLDEFLTAICNIAPKQIVNMFFGNFKKSKHCFSDSYKYNSILQFDLKDNFKLTAGYLKYFNPKEPLILMYDPGHFSSVIVGQFNKKTNELRIIKEFFVWHPKQQSDLARMIHAFFYDDSSCHRIELFYDRAGNKRREIQAKITTDAKQLKMELDVLGFRVRLQNEKQRTIFYYEHYKLALILFGEELRNTPRVRICENECPNLVSSIHLSPLRHTDDGKIELDKTSEDKVALPYQAGLTTQLPSALTYGLFGLFQNFLPSNIKRKQTMPDNIST